MLLVRQFGCWCKAPVTGVIHYCRTQNSAIIKNDHHAALLRRTFQYWLGIISGRSATQIVANIGRDGFNSWRVRSHSINNHHKLGGWIADITGRINCRRGNTVLTISQIDCRCKVPLTVGINHCGT